MRDETLDVRTRLHAAKLAAQYVHAKPASGGKKEAQADAAKAQTSRFATTAPPRLVFSKPKP